MPRQTDHIKHRDAIDEKIAALMEEREREHEAACVQMGDIVLAHQNMCKWSMKERRQIYGLLDALKPDEIIRRLSLSGDAANERSPGRMQHVEEAGDKELRAAE